MNIIYLCSIIFVIIYIILYAYIKLRYRFWSLQPVFHIYNLYYLFYEGVILSELPPKNKYYNPLFKTDHVNITPEFIDFITANFLNTKSIKYEPTKTDIESYYKNSKDSLLTSYYYNNILH